MQIQSRLRRNLPRCFPVCQPEPNWSYADCQLSLVVVIPSRCEGSRFLAKLEMTPEEVGTELMSPNSDCCSFVCCGICDDTAGNQNGNCHLAQLG